MIDTYDDLKILPVKENISLISEVDNLSDHVYVLRCKKNDFCHLLKQCLYNQNHSMNRCKNNEEEYYILNLDNKNVGYFSVRTNLIKKRLFISKLHLNPNVKSKGFKIGRQIINMLIDKCKQSNISKLQFHTSTKNNSVGLYKKWGFKILKNINKYVSPEIREHYYLMNLSI